MGFLRPGKAFQTVGVGPDTEKEREPMDGFTDGTARQFTDLLLALSCDRNFP